MFKYEFCNQQNWGLSQSSIKRTHGDTHTTSKNIHIYIYILVVSADGSGLNMIKQASSLHVQDCFTFPCPGLFYPPFCCLRINDVPRDHNLQLGSKQNLPQPTNQPPSHRPHQAFQLLTLIFRQGPKLHQETRQPTGSAWLIFSQATRQETKHWLDIIYICWM